LADEAAARTAIDTAQARLQGLDVLINAAGAFRWQTVVDADPAVWDSMFTINLKTAVNSCRAAIPHLRASRAGRIVNVGAYGALKAGAGMGAYAASKAGVHRLTESLAAELKDQRITVNAVLPSIIDTPPNRKDMPKADFSTWVTTESLANILLFLASEQAQDITGALLPVTGRV
jgi:3-oxoacyl-[acyl-carrier protein] reductase